MKLIVIFLLSFSSVAISMEETEIVYRPDGDKFTGGGTSCPKCEEAN